MSKLFEDNSGSESDVDLKTDSQFAKNYNTWRQKEELHKLHTKYGDDNLDSSSSSEDDEGDEVNEEFEKGFFKALSCLKNKDPRIYNKDFEFFNAQEEGNGVSEIPAKKKKKEQPMFLKDYERNLILDKGGKLSDDEEDHPESKTSTYVEEQQQLKENLKDALSTLDKDLGDEDWGGMFKTRQKTAEEKTKEEQDYLQWLAGQTDHLKDENVETDLKPLKDFWTNPKLEDGEKFLRDYVLKKKFLDTEDADYIPTYEEVVHDSDADLSEDENALSTQEEFEHKYNFRFEEPDQDFIKRYPRTMEHSLRQKDEKRKVKRSERKERKKEEKQEKMKEIEQLRAYKKKEIEEKIEKLKEITGNTDVGFEVKDFEDDFDPEEHDKRMQTLFNDDFYVGPEGEQKPEFPDLDKELELDNWDYWHGNDADETGGTAKNEEHQPYCEDEDFNMDCDYDPASTQKELIENSKKKKKQRRKSKFAKVLSQPKPVFDPNDKSYQQYLDEYYKLDCEDVIGDIPCRFKYREVVPNSFGLSIEEILTAKDKELNRWCSLKKAVQYRPDHVEKYDLIAFEKKGKNVHLKKKYLPSLFVEEKVDNMAPSTSTTESKEVTETTVSKKKSKKNAPVETSTTKVESNRIYPSAKNVEDEVANKDQQNVHNSPKNDKTETKATDEDNASMVKSKKNGKNKRKFSELQNSNSSSKNDLGKKRKKHSNNNKHKNTASNIGISDARLTAYGLNPKKFKNKLKYGNN